MGVISAVSWRLESMSRVVVAIVGATLVAALVLAWLARDTTKTITVDFRTTNSVYSGSDVKILGVPVGKVTELEPRGDVVRATIEYDDSIDLPADVKAAVISPSIVGDRFVQLAPAHTSGAVLPDDAHLSVERSAVPIELDEIYDSLHQLAIALGPNGANEQGSLSRLVDAAAVQLEGQGGKLNETFRQFGALAVTLENNSSDLFASVTEVEEFVQVLRRNDESVRGFNRSTAELADVLSDEREALAGTLQALGVALADVDALVAENHDVLTTNVEKITSLSQVLREREAEFDELLVTAPTALSNVALTYNGKYGTLDNRAGLQELLLGGVTDPAGLLCNLLEESRDAEGGLCSTLAGLVPEMPELPETPGGLGRTAPTNPRSVAAWLEVPS